MSANLNTRILVTGGAGFLGSYVVERLRAGGYTETLQNDRVAPTDPGVIPGKAPWTGGGKRSPSNPCQGAESSLVVRFTITVTYPFVVNPSTSQPFVLSVSKETAGMLRIGLSNHERGGHPSTGSG
jgi:NAD dependent epimerase/dehydratase family